MIIYIDMDGVLFDWYGGVLDLFSIDKNDRKIQQEIWTKGISALVPKKEMWKRIGKAGSDWWANLDVFPWTYRLWKYCNDLSDGQTYILSSPSLNAASIKGKMQAVQHHFKTNNFIFTPHKELCANKQKGTILIDDNEKQIQKFAEAGGKIIHFPNQYTIQYWEQVKRYVEFYISDNRNS